MAVRQQSSAEQPSATNCQRRIQANQAFAYDSVNRLTLAEEKANSGAFSPGGCSDTGMVWIQGFSYDAAGNRTVACQPGSNGWDVGSFSATTNQISDPNWTYDLAGNLKTTNAVAGSRTLKFDAENRMAQNCSGASCVNYIYDGLGNRVMETDQNGTPTLTMAYDAFGNLASENLKTAVTGPGTQFLTADHLGSTRLVMGAQTERHDYQPFGTELFASNGSWRGSVAGYGLDSGVRQKFTGQEREGDLDFFINRYYSWAQGRFLSPDPGNAGASLGDPQTWNGYAYVGNSPLSNVDPYGLGEGGSGGLGGGDIPPVFGGGGGGVIPRWGNFPVGVGGSNPSYGMFGCGGGVFGGGSSCPFIFSFADQANPSFNTMWSNYPTDVYSTDARSVPSIWGLIGGKVGWNGNQGIFGNSCTVRICYTLNQSGLKIP